MTDTPLTDAQAAIEYPHWLEALIGMAKHARTLERERAALIDARDSLTKALSEGVHVPEGWRLLPVRTDMIVVEHRKHGSYAASERNRDDIASVVLYRFAKAILEAPK